MIDSLNKVNNAGIGGADSRIVTNEGVELVWATNVLSYHLLSVLLSAPLSRSKMGMCPDGHSSVLMFFQ
jgi:NAD(P)-dependent dehydrogenase (short-subunit alcohol dehydrogenase family)